MSLPLHNLKFLAVIFTSCVVEVLFQLGSLLSSVPGLSKSRFARQLTGRTTGGDSTKSIAPSNPESRGDLLFFCSSAGEFEQALPIIERISTHLGLEPLVLFLSRSGLEYMRARGETIRAALAPPDSLWRWRRFESRHRICASVVIRHEWWPSFLSVFGRNRPMFLIDAGRPAGSPDSKLKNLGRGYLARQFTRICAVDEASRDFFVKRFQINPPQIIATGDTKFDRVMDRATRTKIGADLRNQVINFTRGRRVLVAGSIYSADLDLLTAAWRTNPDIATSWAVIAVPHHIDVATTTKLQNQIQLAGCDFLLVNQMGVLAELYSLADAAWIGGACHNKVHNVLEPASHGLNLGCGMRFTNSPEAVQMQRAGILRAVATSDEQVEWLMNMTAQHADGASIKSSPSRSFVIERTGASKIICSLLEQSLTTMEGI